MELTTTDGYRQLLQQISHTYTEGRVRAVQAVNTHLVETYWRVGQHIVEFEQAGQIRAEYGKALIENLATDLSLRYGKGFSRSNLIRFRQFYFAYPKSATLSHQLTWSHIVELLKLDDPGWAMTMVVYDKWIVRLRGGMQWGELERISPTCTGRIRELAEPYATPLPQLTDEVAVLAAREGHLKQKGTFWK